MNVLADSAADYRFDKDTKTFKPAAEVQEGPTFTVRQLDYWRTQDLLDKDRPMVERIRSGLRHGLASIDGKTELVDPFIEAPKAVLVNPLFDLILDVAVGN